MVDSCRKCANCKRGLEQHCLTRVSFTYNGVEQDGKTATQGGYSTTLVVDEAYGEFADRTALDEVDEDRAIVVVRTYSKVWSMAALRLGYCVAPTWVVDELEKVVLPYHLAAATQAAGTVALRHGEEMRARVRELVGERDRLRLGLDGLGGVAAAWRAVDARRQQLAQLTRLGEAPGLAVSEEQLVAVPHVELAAAAGDQRHPGDVVLERVQQLLRDEVADLPRSAVVFARRDSLAYRLPIRWGMICGPIDRATTPAKPAKKAYSRWEKPRSLKGRAARQARK